MTKTVDTALSTWTALTARYHALQAEMKKIRDELGKVKGLGRYRPHAILQLCAKCGAGPFDARELRAHKCVRQK